MSTSKLRVIKDYDKLDTEIVKQIEVTYPEGFTQHLIQITSKDGMLVSALPFETEDKIYLVRMTAQNISFNSDSFDEKLLDDATKEISDAELDYLRDSDDNEDEDIDEKYDNDRNIEDIEDEEDEEED